MLTGGIASAQLGGNALPVLKLALNGKSVTVSGAKVSGAVTVQTTVTKVRQGEPTLAYIKPGATAQQAFAAVARAHGDLNALNPYAAIVYDNGAPKGTSSGQVVLVPGNYLALDTQSNAAVPPNAPFTVLASPHPAKLPKPSATVSTIEFGFTGPTTLRQGSLVRFQNLGYLVHMDVYVQVKSVKDAQKVIALLKAGKDGQAQKLTIGPGGGFAGPVSPGAIQQEVVTAKPGIYVQACFMTTQDGREHTRLGMERMFKVIK
jgi:hypothetical protein